MKLFTSQENLRCFFYHKNIRSYFLPSSTNILLHIYHVSGCVPLLFKDWHVVVLFSVGFLLLLSLLSYMSSLHILGVKPLLDVTICNYLFSFSRLPFAAGFLHAQYLNILYHRPTDVTLTLKDPHYPDHDLGIILLSVVLTPKEGEHVVSSRRVWL